MSRRNAFLLGTILLLVVLTEVVVLGWTAEAIFFVTWMLLVLTMRHDSRLSAAVGLIFLAICPLLLIAKQQPAAEQAANYAYFFLAIGVLVQLEDLVLERFGWLDRKLDLSPLRSSASGAVRRAWSATAGRLGRLPGAAGLPIWVWGIQFAGAAGLVAVSWSIASYGLRPPFGLLALLGVAVLLPLIAWALQRVLHRFQQQWLRTVALAVVVLPVAAVTMNWLQGLTTVDRLARMHVAYDFRAHLAEAEVMASDPNLVRNNQFVIDGSERPVLFMHPDARARYTLQVPKGGILAFDVATSPESWTLPGDGVRFSVYLESGLVSRQLFSTYIDPKQNAADRPWHPYTLDLDKYAGQTVTLTFETGTGPADDNRYDWAGWGQPRLLAP